MGGQHTGSSWLSTTEPVPGTAASLSENRGQKAAHPDAEVCPAPGASFALLLHADFGAFRLQGRLLVCSKTGLPLTTAE